MSTTPIDYDALAKQHGAQPAMVDYGALAAQHGALPDSATGTPTDSSLVGPGNAFTSGHPLDTLRANLEDTTRDLTPEEQQNMNPLEKGLRGFGKGAANTLIRPMLHPVDTAMGLLKSLPHATNPLDPENPATQMFRAPAEDYARNGAAEGTGNLLGTVGAGLLGSEMGGEALSGAQRLAAPMGAAAERGGLGVINHALDVTPKMMKYGQNPARGVVDEGLTPSLSKFSLANKVDSALPVAGQRISDAVHSSPLTVPSQNVAASIEHPILGAGDVSSGFGGTGRVEPLADLWGQTEIKAPGASRPIYGSGSPADISAPDLWHSIRNLDANTRFNPDPEVEGVNEVRRDIRGGLRGNLEDAVPGLKPLSERYGDLRTADEALSRTAGRGSSLKGLKDAFTFPAETAAGTAMVRGGRLLQTPISPFAGRSASAAPLFFAPKRNDQ